jgi:nicotinate-nucleotide pyrophosphorylase (carboxylating)
LSCDPRRRHTDGEQSTAVFAYQDVSQEGADVVLLDNMTLAELRQAVKTVAGKMLCEESGNINLKTIKDVAESGVDIISCGALTHSAPVLDLGLDIQMI